MVNYRLLWVLLLAVMLVGLAFFFILSMSIVLWIGTVRTQWVVRQGQQPGVRRFPCRCAGSDQAGQSGNRVAAISYFQYVHIYTAGYPLPV